MTGIYCYDPSVFEVIGTLEPSGRGELEITDVNNYFVEQRTMAYDILEGFWGDAGESIDAYYAVNDFVREQRRQQGLSAGDRPRRRAGSGVEEAADPEERPERPDHHADRAPPPGW